MATFRRWRFSDTESQSLVPLKFSSAEPLLFSDLFQVTAFQPTNVQAVELWDRVILSWDEPSDFGDLPVYQVGYKIFRDDILLDTIGDITSFTDLSGDPVIYNPPTDVTAEGHGTEVVLEWLDGSVVDGTLYKYVIRAFNNGETIPEVISGEGDDSDDFYAQKSDDFTTHDIARSDDEGVSYPVVYQSETSPFVNKHLTTGRIYFYRLRTRSVQDQTSAWTPVVVAWLDSSAGDIGEGGKIFLT